MGNETPRTQEREGRRQRPREQKPQTSAHRRRRRRRGVPQTLAIALVILALAVGGGLGYLLGHRPAGDSLVAERDVQLASANQRIQELEGMLTDAGIDPNADVFDGAQPLDPDVVSALDGGDQPANANDALLDGSDSFDTPAATVAPVVVAEFGDVQVMSDEVLDVYNTSLNQQLFSGQDVGAYAETLLDEALSQVVEEKVKLAKAEELGLATPSAEDEAAIDANAQERYEQTLAFYVQNDGTMTADEAREDAVTRMEADGITLESFRDEAEGELLEEKLRDYAAQGVTVTDGALQEVYDRYLSEQQPIYDANPGQYEYDLRYGETTVVYNPAGYRTFKQVLIPFDAGDAMRVEEINLELGSLDAGTDAQRIEELNGELNTLYAKLEPTAEEALDRVAEGASIDSLIAEYGDASSEGEVFYISDASTTYETALKEAVMALAEPGDISQVPVRTAAGLCIFYYNADVPAGPVPLEDVREALEGEALQSLRDDAYNAQLAQWVEEANVTYHREALEENA